MHIAATQQVASNSINSVVVNATEGIGERSQI
jgi:hypothetical protein